MEQNISRSVKVFILRDVCAAECSSGASVTERQSDATLWMKLCLISPLHIRIDARRIQSKQNEAAPLRAQTFQQVSLKQEAHSCIPSPNHTVKDSDW